jgi:uncharacterized membrane protein YdjX (TVP38/TMEM64 family)
VAPAPRARALLRLGALAAVLVAAYVVARRTGVLELRDPATLADLVRRAQQVPWAAPAFVAAYAVIASLGLPGTPLTLAGGALFGTVGGTALNWVGATLGATGAFLLARTLGGDAVRRLLGSRAGALDALAGGAGFTALLRLRLIPVVPFNALNFGAGLAGMRPAAYVGATALGILPGTAVYTYFADALLAGATGAQRQALGQVAIAGGLLVLLSFVPTLARRFGWLAAAAVVALPRPAGAQATAADHAAFDALLKAHVVDGMVDYDAFRRDARFAQYLAAMEQVRPAALSRDDRLAFWINVYNAWTIQLILSHGETRSIRNINKSFGLKLKGPWSEALVRADGRLLTLDDVEHRIIRKEFGEPRIHLALVCAAMGCPPLRREAYVGGRLDQQLDDQGREFLLRSAAKNRVEVATRTVYGSMIFKYYDEDFGGDLAGIGRFWARYFPAGPERDLLLAGGFKYVQTDYDWTLNSQANARRLAGR